MKIDEHPMTKDNMEPDLPVRRHNHSHNGEQKLEPTE
jgi:hypothetical protein